MVTATDVNGVYYFAVPPGDYQVAVQIPPGTQAATSNAGSDDTVDSDGVSDGLGNSVATATLSPQNPLPFDSSTDFGFLQTPVQQPGTGTPGYWVNHPEAWPVDSITVGGVAYSKADALAWLAKGGKDKTVTMFSSLVPAKLNVLIGNDGSCVSSTISAADDWMQKYGPVGNNVHAASMAWKVGEPLHRQLDNYNNGMLCAPGRE
jgi:SdrD B-like domain